MTSQPSSPSDSEQTGVLAGICLELVRARFGTTQGPVQLPPNLDVQSLIEFAGRHGAAAALAGGIRKAGVEGAYATGLKMMLDALETSTRQRNARMKEALACVGALLAAEDIACIALKGGAFLAEASTVPGWRNLSDLDVLVPAAALPTAREILMQHGFVHAMEEDAYREADHYHYTPLVPPGADFAVEMHTRFAWDTRTDPLDPAEVLKQALPSTVAGISVPCASDRITHLVAHGQLGDKGHAARRILLKDIIDYAELAQAHDIEWTEVERAFAGIGKRPVLSGFLKAAETILQGAAPDTGLSLDDGSKWARQATENLSTGRTDQAGAAADIARDYVNRVLFRKGGIKLLLGTLLDRERLLRLWDTQARKWRN